MRRRGSSIVVEYVPYGIGTKLKNSYVRIKAKPMRDQSASKQPRSIQLHTASRMV